LIESVEALAWTAESGNYPSGIILAPVKAAIDDSLNTPSQGLEQGSNGQCGGHDDEGLLRDGSCHEMHERLEADN
jgi:hypothetical protein